MAPSARTIKRLFTLSGNKCAFPDCQNQILNENGTLVSDICHIEARSQGGPRYNSEQTDVQRDGFENLLLMCKIHHTVIDKEYEFYTVARLKEYKAGHEQKNMNGVEPTNEVVEELLETINKNDKGIYIGMLKSEIELCISRLDLDKPRLLPVDRWTSAVNSGALTLFNHDESGALSRVYQEIKDYNHVITSEHFDRYSWEMLEKEQGYRLPIMIVRPFLSHRLSLLDKLRTLKGAEWLNSS